MIWMVKTSIIICNQNIIFGRSRVATQAKRNANENNSKKSWIYLFVFISN